MRATWIALATILGISLLGAYLLGRALEKAKPKRSLAPRGATVVGVKPLSDDQRVLLWRMGGHAEEPMSSLYGVTLVEGRTRLYSHRAPRGSLRLSVETGDISGDGRQDVLVFDDTGGSGACGDYRAVVLGPGSSRVALRRPLCEDQGSIHLRRGGLLVSVGEKKDPKTREQIHCCYRFVRRTLVRWNETHWTIARSSVERLPPEHPYPGGHAPGGPA
jgi:hypothetical protein